MCTERQCRLNKIARLAFKRCNCHLNVVHNVQQGNQNPPARFEKIVIAPAFCTLTYSSALDPYWPLLIDHQFLTATPDARKPYGDRICYIKSDMLTLIPPSRLSSGNVQVVFCSFALCATLGLHNLPTSCWILNVMGSSPSPAVESCWEIYSLYEIGDNPLPFCHGYCIHLTEKKSKKKSHLKFEKHLLWLLITTKNVLTVCPAVVCT